MNYGRQAMKRRKKKVNAKGTKVCNKIGINLLRLALVAVIFLAVVGVSTGLGVWKGIVDSAPDISAMDVTPTGYQTAVYAADGTQTATLVASGANRKYVTIDEVPQDMKDAFVAIEDARFYTHNGIDPKGIARALAMDLASGSMEQGASTITQQLIKNSILEEMWNQETKTSKIEKVQRKVQEQYLAIELEKQVSKDWILENYLNTINLGSNTLGVQAASERYFGKDVSELTLSECAVIAGITKNPSAYNPISHPDKNAARREAVLDAMLEQEFISQEEYDAAMADDVYSRIAEHNDTRDASTTNSYFVDALIDDVFDDLVNHLGYTETEAYKAIYQGGLSIYSTQDLAMQQICDEEVNNLDNYPTEPKHSFSLYFQVKKADGTVQAYTHQTMINHYRESNKDYTICFATEEDALAAIAAYEEDVLEPGDEMVEDSESILMSLEPQAALTVIDQQTGQVKALVGGRGEKEGNRILNRATDAVRQPGSTFKIIGCYAPALDAGGMTLASVQDNAPYTVGSKTYRNYDGKYTGYTTVREAITDSINIVTVKTLEEIGVNMGYDYAQKFGFTTLVEGDKNLGLSLGGLSYGVTNLELTAAYATIANQGVYNEPKFYTYVYDHDGNILLDATANQKTHEVLEDTTAWLLTSAMQDVMTKGTGTKAYFGGSMPQAGKSGTTTSNRDCLFAGYTPYYTCVVWGGNDDNSVQKNGQTTYPKMIWKGVMGRIHSDLEYKNFTMPSGITSATVCSESGLVPQEGVCELDPMGLATVRTEYFAKGTVPTDTCDHHVNVTVCQSSNMLAGEYCPADLVSVKAYYVGLSEGSSAYPYNISKEFPTQTCNVHLTPVEIPEVPENPEQENPGSVIGDPPLDPVVNP